ncbi:MAG: fructosamine kinase family protein [Gallionella sp.]|nr:fructosamine kinase family protein [Gallionella sp.]MDD4945465.1 fructosamine kinase family protein [Gallionella sp.]MDD5612492.1 fructosamine kinase family protein [Gallionella sp.]
MVDWSAIAAAIGSATGQTFQLANCTPLGGGCINLCYRLAGRDGRTFFIKLNDAHLLPMLVAEAAGLAVIAATRTLRVPQAITYGIAGRHGFLLLEHLALNTHGDVRQLGEQLAALHRHTAPRFGFAQDNFIGTNPQSNDWSDDWPTFWGERRIGYQLRLAAKNGLGSKLQTVGEKLLDALPALFGGYQPQASLLHGDLWSGNHAYLASGQPVIFDPAASYGDRECELAMTELFGGYPADFYAAYRASYPLDAGYPVRRELYNLYHILNHANLFGGSYARQAEGMMQRLLAEAG